MIGVSVQNISRVSAFLTSERQRERKALVTSVKVTGYGLRRELQHQIRAGAPGGKKFAGLSFLARRWGAGKGGRLRPDKPLRALANVVRYDIPRHDPIEMHIGWVGPKLSRSWKRLARIQQEGFSFIMPEARRRSFIDYGAAMGARSQARRYMFIKQSTRTFVVPRREIIEPFWDQQRDRAAADIAQNFRRKLKGERI